MSCYIRTNFTNLVLEIHFLLLAYNDFGGNKMQEEERKIEFHLGSYFFVGDSVNLKNLHTNIKRLVCKSCCCALTTPSMVS